MFMGLSRATGCLAYVAEEKPRCAANLVKTMLSLIPKVKKMNDCIECFSILVMHKNQTRSLQNVLYYSKHIKHPVWLLQT